jgi:hypothetical protein
VEKELTLSKDRDIAERSCGILSIVTDCLLVDSLCPFRNLVLESDLTLNFGARIIVAIVESKRNYYFDGYFHPVRVLSPGQIISLAIV